MKKIFNLLLIAVATLGIASSCSDVPLPYEIGSASFGKKLPYKSSNLNAGWQTIIADGYENNPWSLGSTYAQASSSQYWDGTNRSNKEVCGYLISPAINTTCKSGKVKFFFDMCIGYSNYDSNYAEHIGLYVSKDYDGSNFADAQWEKLNFTYPSSAVNANWSLETTNEIQLPTDYVNVDGIYFAFYFYGSSEGSATWELENFTIEEGDAVETPNTPIDAIEVTCAQAKELCNSLEDGGTSAETYSITGYITEVVGSVSRDQQTFWMADAKDGGKVFQAYYANLPEGVSAFTKGAKVKITGQLLKYVKDGAVTAEIKNATVEILENGEDGNDQSTNGVEVNCADAVKICEALAAGATSAEIYSVTGYITEVVGSVSRNQQTFWMADAKDGGKVFEAYYANLPEGVSAFTKGSKVKITGQIMKYVKDDNVTPEIKNATVEILENGEDGNENTDTNEGLSISGTTVTLTNNNVTLGNSTVTLIVNDLGLEDKAAATGTYSFSDGTKLTIAQGSGKSAPTYYSATNGFRIYASNTLKFEADKDIAKIVFECDEYNGTKYVGNETATISFAGKTAEYCNYNSDNSGGTQLRVKTITITYAK